MQTLSMIFRSLNTRSSFIGLHCNRAFHSTAFQQIQSAYIQAPTAPIQVKTLLSNPISPFHRSASVVSLLQLYSSSLYGAVVLCQTDPTLVIETSALVGAMLSFSASIFFGLRLYNHTIVTGLKTFRLTGNPEELVELTLAGVTKPVVHAVRRKGSASSDMILFRIGKTTFTAPMDRPSSSSFVDAKELDKLITSCHRNQKE